jgi:NAD(P)-dependent dehydrogenase (short-subunit alcohol dehydrogenase family)
VNGDAANLADLDYLFAEIKRHEGRFDILFAHAGTALRPDGRSARSCSTRFQGPRKGRGGAEGAAALSEQQRKIIAGAVPLGTPEEIAKAVGFSPPTRRATSRAQSSR